MVLEIAALCLSLNIYFESRSESITARTAVAEVTMARSNYDQNNICKEVYRKGAFGWVKGNRRNNAHYLKIVNSHNQPGNKKAWDESKQLARKVILGQHKKALPRKATHFYNPKIDPKPRWATKERFVAQIGTHRFYHIRD